MTDNLDDQTSFEAAEASAALALGRLDGALHYAPANTLRIFAAWLLSDTLIGALRWEGHAFTQQRFHAWFAGLSTLTDTPSPQACPPKALCEAILTELTHSSWPPLADIALHMSAAFLAPRDLDVEAASATLHEVIRDARTLIQKRGRNSSTSLFTSLEELHEDILASLRFAPPERHVPAIKQSAKWLPAERRLAPPLWAVELHFGEHLSVSGWLRPALPLIGLIRIAALEDSNIGAARTQRAAALYSVAHEIYQRFDEAVKLSRFEAEFSSNRRSTSRAPALFELLAGFGPMRSMQMERVLGASRLGVRSMITALMAEQMIAPTTIAGSHIYSALTGDREYLVRSAAYGESAFSTGALNDFDASMAQLDDLLARHPEN